MTHTKRKQKPGWKMVKFGDVVKNANLVEREPIKSGIERIVGLEHLDPGNLHIRRWNNAEDGTSFSRKFAPGQTLFAKRRAYQRKVAFAEFEGICSGDILTFEPKDPKILLPELLPFICQSNAFFDHALGTSAGSLSPRTSWKALAGFEFPIPPLSEQKRIAEILWAADEAVVTQEAAFLEFEALTDAFASDFLSRDWPRKPLGDLLESVQYGSSKRMQKQDSSLLPILRIPNVIGGGIDLSDLGWVKLNEKEAEKYRLESGDVLIVRTNGNPDYVGRTAVVRSVPADCVYASYLIRLKADKSVLRPTYLHASLSSSMIRRTLRHEIRSSAGNYNLNSKGIKRQRLPIPPITDQKHFIARFNMFQDKRDALRDHICSLSKLRQCLVDREIGACHV